MREKRSYRSMCLFHRAGLEKEYHRLAGYAKTKVLKPGEKELLKIRIDRKTLAYFSEEQHAWIAEKGYYAVWVGNSICIAYAGCNA